MECLKCGFPRNKNGYCEKCKDWEKKEVTKEKLLARAVDLLLRIQNEE